MRKLESLTVYLDDSVPEYMDGIVRCGRVVAGYDDGTEEDFENYVDNTEYTSVRELLVPLSKDFNVDVDFIEVIS